MKKNNVNHLLEYLSPIFVLSYFFIHNIFIVLIGITFSVYLININFINSSIRTIYKEIAIMKLNRVLKKNDNETKSESLEIGLTKEDSKPTLVEEVETLGFIPSIDENKESKAA